MFALQRIEDGKYVASPGSKNSYTTRLELARKYQTREQAQADACGNERIVDLYTALSR